MTTISKTSASAASTSGMTKKKKKKQQTTTTKRYRLRIQLRPCVLYLIFLIPCFILMLEKYFGSYENLTLIVGDTWNDLLVISQAQATKDENDYTDNKLSHVPPIRLITQTPRKPCPKKGLQRMFDLHSTKSLYGNNINPTTSSSSSNTNTLIHHHHNISKRIPHIVHQTSGLYYNKGTGEGVSSRCLTEMYISACYKWILSKWSYYFHDSNAIYRLLYNVQYPEFPYLNNILQYCVASPQNHNHNIDLFDQQILFTLWKYLVLWMYGGVYVDLNVSMLRPKKKNRSSSTNGGVNNDEEEDEYTILKSYLQQQQQQDDDESDDKSGGGGILIYDPIIKQIRLDFMAFPPRHPLLFNVIQYLLISILRRSRKQSTRVQQQQQQQPVNVTYEYEIVNQFVRNSFELGLNDYRRMKQKDQLKGVVTTDIGGTGVTKSIKYQPYRRSNITIYGPQDSKIRILGYGELPDTYLTYVASAESIKQSEYSKMNMINTFDTTTAGSSTQQQQQQQQTQKTEKDGGKSCFRLMLDNFAITN